MHSALNAVRVTMYAACENNNQSKHSFIFTRVKFCFLLFLSKLKVRKVEKIEKVIFLFAVRSPAKVQKS